MKKIAKISMLALGAAMVTQALQAQTTPANPGNNDLVLGFTSQAPGVTQDYILDLGQIPSGQNVQLGGISLSTFNTVFGSALANGEVNVGIVGGLPTGSVADVITSTLHLTGAPGEIPSVSQSKSAGDDVLGTTPGVVAQNATTSFSSDVALSPTATGTANNNFSAQLGSNPLSTIGSSETITLDLYEDTQTSRTSTGGWVYEGDIALDLTGSTLSAVFDPVAVPEPSTYGLLAGAGLLLVALRRQISRKAA
jgi:PEP-CTERM motif